MLIIKRLKLKYQESTYDCGISSLLSILRYYKCNVTRSYLEKISLTTKEGSTMYGLMIAAKNLGFNSYGVNGTISTINNKNTPFIAHLKLKDNVFHYVIITKITPKKIIIKDPSVGIKKITLEEFNEITTNNYLFIEKTINIKKLNNIDIIKKTLTNLIIKRKKTIIVIIFLICFSLCLELLNIFSLKVILNNAIIIESINNLLILLSTFLILLILKNILAFIINIHINKLIAKFSYKLKLALINHLLTLPNIYYQTKERGVVISLFNDIDIFTEYFISSILTVTNSVFILSFIYIYFLNLSSLMSIVLLISNLLLFAFIWLQRKVSISNLEIYYQTKNNYDNKIQQIITNNEKIKGLNLEKIMAKKFSKVMGNNIEASYRINRYKQFITTILNSLEGVSYLLILGISGILLITTNNITLTTFILIESFIFMTLKNAEALTLVIFKYQECLKIKERLEDIFSLQKEVLLPSNYNYPLHNLSIIIKNLSFKYVDGNNIDKATSKTDNLILDNINIKINPKDKIFIYGNSGSGKSTLVKLLGRYLPVEYNHIKIGGIDITHYNLADLRNIITYIPNDEMLSNGNLKDNIYLERKPFINLNQLLKMTGVKHLLNDKEYNMDTIIYDNGENLSKGEKSRISLAQGLFKPSEVFILDECLSNVDTSLEKEILENILNYYKDKIIIYISHRLTNKNLFNRVFYLDKGKCYEKF